MPKGIGYGVKSGAKLQGLVGKLKAIQTGQNKVSQRMVKIRSKHIGNGAGTR